MLFRHLTALPAPLENAGDDLVLGTRGGDILAGEAGNDILLGFAAPDGLRGDYGSVTLAPGDTVPEFGDDALIGGEGTDDACGDADALTLKMENGGNLTVETGDDFFDSHTGASYSGVDRNYGDVNSLVVNVTGNEGGNIQLFTGDDVMVGGRNTESFGDAYDVSVNHAGIGGEVYLRFGDDKLFGGAQLVGDSVYLTVTGSGSPAVTIEGGDDVLGSESHGAILVGDFRIVNLGTPGGQSATVICGDDTLIGSGEDDYLAGDNDYSVEDGLNYVPGADTFVFRDDFGNDEIMDFNAGLDMLVFEGFDGAGFDDIGQSLQDDGLKLNLTALGGGTVLLHDVVSLDPGDVTFA